MNVAVTFLKEAWLELKRASWLTRSEAVDSTRAVVLLVGILSVYVAGIDFVLSIILRPLLGR